MASTLMLLLITMMVFAQLPIDVLSLARPRVLKRARKRCERTRLATLNCRTLLADELLDDLDVSLTEKDIAICALQEVRRDGFLSKRTTNYEIYWYGECSGSRGVGFAVHKKYAHLVTNVRGLPQSDGRIMSMEVLLHDANYPVTLICAYSPTNARKHSKARDKFYSQLRSVTTDNSWLMGDFNARVGRQMIDDPNGNYGAVPSNTIGPWSLKGDLTPNANGSLLIDIASEKGLRHVSSNFSCRDSKRWTWRHPRYRTRARLDHIFVPSKQLRFISRSYVAPNIALFTDHRLAVCELTFRPRIAKTSSPRPPSIDNRALLDTDVCKAFQAEITNTLGDVEPELLPSLDISNSIRTVPVLAANKVLPSKSKSRFPEEFSVQTIDLIRRKRKLWKFLQSSGQRVTRSMREAYRSLRRDTRHSIASDRIALLETEAAELADTFKHDRFKGYRLLKRQHRARTKAVMPPEKEFTDHYRTQYQLGAEVPLEVSGCVLPASPLDDVLSRDDFDSGIRSLNANRQPGHDGCAPEYLKHGGPVLHQWMFVLMTRVWQFVCDLPPVDRIGRLIPIPKKSSSTSVDTTRPICLLTSTYKLYAIIVFQKVRDRVKEFVSWTQAGFIRGRSCSNNLWILRRVAERSIEFNVPVYCALVDYKGAFDALNRTTLGRVLSLFLSPSMVRRVISLYFDAKAKVMVSGVEGPEFDLFRGVRQGCPASPSFFTVALAFISWSFRLTFEGIKLVHHHLSTLEYADDQILFTLSPDALQDMLNFIVENAAPFGLKLSPAKCELICFHRIGSIDKTLLPRIQVAGKTLSWKSSVVYLGSRIAEDGNTLAAIKHRICCAESVVKRLNDRVFARKSVGNKLKGHFINSAVFSSLLYGLEHCSVGIRDRRCLDGFFLRLAKRVMHLRFDFHLSYAEAEEQLGVRRPSSRLASERLRWVGHALRSDDSVLREVLDFIPTGGARGRGRPRRRYFDTIKADLEERNITITSRRQDRFWAELAVIAADRKEWRSTVVEGGR